MSLQNVILDIRKKNDLTQEEMAEKLFVTRQAVSRWETGETTPTIDTLKTLSKIFNIDANTLFGFTTSPICQSCSMPLVKIEDFGNNSDKTINMEYCEHCFNEGQFTHNRTIEEMIETNLKFLDEFNSENGTAYSIDEARIILKAHLATLKRWKNK